MIFSTGFAIARLRRIRGLLVGGLALAVLAASLTTPALAQQCVTVGTNQTCTNAIFLSGGATGITDAATLDVTNLASGTLAGTATDATGVGANATGVSATTANVNNLGAISATATETGAPIFATTATGISSTGDTSVANSSTISANASLTFTSGSSIVDVSGIMAGTTANVTNSGAVLANATVTATTGPLGTVQAFADGIQAVTADVMNSGAITANASAANATGTSNNATANGIQAIDLTNFTASVTHVTNSETIAAIATVTGTQSSAVATGINTLFNANVADTANVMNSGMISAMATASGMMSSANATDIKATIANVTNSGTLMAVATGTEGAASSATGIFANATADITNSGTISTVTIASGAQGSAGSTSIEAFSMANVTNSGTILTVATASGAQSFASATGIGISTASIVTNSGTIAAMATAAGAGSSASATGISAPMVNNFGTITAIASAPDATGVNGNSPSAFGVSAFPTTNVTNSGTITAMASGSGAQAFGIEAFTTASVNNSGVVKAVATGSGALSFGITAATVNVVNSGLVSGGTGIAAGGTSLVATKLVNANIDPAGTHSTIVNSGTIIGTNGVAIDFTGQSLAAANPGSGTAISSSNDTLTLLPGSRILGEILLGTNDTVNIDIESRLSSVLTLNFGDATGAHGLSGTGATVNVVTTELSVVHGNQIATLDPTGLALADRTLLDFTGGVSSLIQGRLGEVAGPGTGFAGGGSSLVTSYAAAPGANPNLPTKKAPATAPSPVPSIVAWANAFGGGHVQASDGPDLRATHSYGGVAFGLDAQALSNLRLGAFLGGGFGRLAVAQGSQHIDTDYLTGGIYGHYSFGAPFLDFNLFGGTTHNSSTRLVTDNLGSGLDTATGSYDGSFISPELALGWRIEDLGDGLVWTPAARLRYVAGWFDRYAETGSAQNLVVNSRSLQDVEGRLELAVSKTLPFGDGLIGLQAKAGVIGLTRLGSTSTDVNLIGADFSFPTPGRNQDFGAYAGLGVDYKVTAMISAFASAEGTVLTHSSRYGTARAGFQVKFW